MKKEQGEHSEQSQKHFLVLAKRGVREIWKRPILGMVLIEGGSYIAAKLVVNSLISGLEGVTGKKENLENGEKTNLPVNPAKQNRRNRSR